MSKFKKIQPPRQKALYTREEYNLLAHWYLSLSDKDLPTPPFELKPGHTVTGPLFFERLREDISRGRRGARAMTGALQDDLVDLMIYIFDRRPKFVTSIKEE